MVDLLHMLGLVNYSILHQKKYPKLPNNEKNTDDKEKPLLLFSPLDWGLGHTTRCIPLLLEFMALGWKILVACNSTQKALLAKELPGLNFIELQGYNVFYGRNMLLTRLYLCAQFIKILTKVKKENRWVKDFLSRNKVAAILSDNRYGFFSIKVPSIFITHQLKPLSGFGNFADRIVQRFLYKYINRFALCWVPDYPDEGIAGELSHPQIFPNIPVQYVGAVSRLNPGSSNSEGAPFTRDALIIISGPEPQRSLFEKKVIKQLADFSNSNHPLKSKFTLVRGLPSEAQTLEIDGVDCHNHLSSDALCKLALSSEYIISRSGYTTIMDMLKLGKKMILVPTPGQTEQEYLAENLHRKKLAMMTSQSTFNLQKSMLNARKFHFNVPELNTGLYRQAVKDFTKLFNSGQPSGSN